MLSEIRKVLEENGFEVKEIWFTPGLVRVLTDKGVVNAVIMWTKNHKPKGVFLILHDRVIRL